MSATGIKRTIQPHPPLPVIGVTVDVTAPGGTKIICTNEPAEPRPKSDFVLLHRAATASLMLP